MLLSYVLLGSFIYIKKKNHTFSSPFVLKLFVCMRSLKKKNTSVHDGEKKVIILLKLHCYLSHGPKARPSLQLAVFQI